MQNELKPFWSRFFSFNWKFGLFLILAVCIPRFILVLKANSSENYGFIGLVMMISAIAPFIFLSKYGRRKTGLTRPQNYAWLFIAFISGLLASFLLYYIGQALYGNSFENWYTYIGKSYNIPVDIGDNDKFTLFMIMAGTGMLFSPVGEELFFRGIVHSSFERSLGEKNASLTDSTAFAVTHLSHFGIVFIDNQWQFFPVPAIIWVLGMFLVSVLFFICKKRSGSILGAIFCHAAFNLGMIWCIFYRM